MTDLPDDVIDELLEYVRHDKGCSADIDEKYRCRCGLRETLERAQCLKT